MRFIDVRGYHEITLKSDTEPAIIAFRSLVAEMCKAELAIEDVAKGDDPSNGLIENTVMLIREIIRTIKCHIESNMQAARCPGVRKVATGESQLQDCTARNHHKSLFSVARKCWRGTSHENL